MSMVCRVCSHPKQVAINSALILRVDSIRKIAAQFRVSPHSLYHHKRACLPPLQEVMRSSLAAVESRAIIDQVAALHQRCMLILSRAEETNQLAVALHAIRECRGNLELLGRLDGTLSPQSSAAGPVNITVTYIDRPAQVVARDDDRVIETSAEPEDPAH
jgi:hypothetical protein